MNSYLIGNSLVRDIQGEGFTTVCLPGANWHDVYKYVRDRPDRFNYVFIYIHVGPVRFTRMHRTENRREVQLITNHGSVRCNMHEWRSLRDRGVIPILCTLYPMNFARYNNSIAVRRNDNRRIVREGRQILRAFYQENSVRIRSMVVQENRDIVAYNKNNNMCTPFMHNHIFTRRRRYYCFRDWLLRDGLHPTQNIIDRWCREMGRIVWLNNEKITSRHW